MRHSKPAFTMIEALVVALMTGGIGLFSAGALQASQEDAESYKSLSTQAVTAWSFALQQCETLKLTNNCHRYISARSYGGASTKRTLLKLSFIPDESLKTLSDTNFRILGSQDSRGEGHELRSHISDEYDFSYTGGGGVLTLDAADFMPGKTHQLLLDLEQIQSDIKVELWIDGQKKLTRLVVGKLSHSNEYLAVGEWENTGKVEAFYGKIAVLGALVE